MSTGGGCDSIATHVIEDGFMTRGIQAEVTAAVDACAWDAVHPTAMKALEIAAEVVDTRGEPALRLDDIADELGISTPALYRYFGGREEILDAAQALRLDRSPVPGTADLLDMVESSSTPVEFRNACGELFRRMINPELSDTLLRRAEIYGAARSRPVLMARVRVIVANWRTMMVEALNEAERRHLVRPRLPMDDIANLYRGMFFGQLQWNMDPDGGDLAPVVEEFAGLMDSLLFSSDD